MRSTELGKLLAVWALVVTACNYEVITHFGDKVDGWVKDPLEA